MYLLGLVGSSRGVVKPKAEEAEGHDLGDQARLWKLDAARIKVNALPVMPTLL
jgi:hypothetical protein